MKALLITGITGFIGSNLAHELSKEYRVHGLVRETQSETCNGLINAGITLHPFTGDIASIVKAIEQSKADAILHIAGKIITNHSSDNIKSLIEGNILFGVQVLEAMKMTKLRSILNISTFHQFFNSEKYNPASLYGATKQSFLDIAQFYVNSEIIHLIDFLVFTTYGPSDRKASLINLLVKSFFQKLPITLFHLNQKMNLIYISDLIAALKIAAKDLLSNQNKTSTKISAFSDLDITVSDLVKTFEQVIGEPLEINSPVPQQKREYTKIAKPYPKLPGWTPKISLIEGLKLVLEGATCI